MAARLLLRVFHFDDVVTWARRSSGLVVEILSRPVDEVVSGDLRFG